MKKKSLILALSLVMLTSCTNKNTDQTQESKEVSTTETKQEEKETKESSKIGGEEKGDGNITLATAGGEGTEVTLIVEPDTSLTQIGINADNVDVDGNEPTLVYIDGQESTKLQLSKDTGYQGTLDLEGDSLKPGIHNVEVIQEKEGEQIFYRLLTYNVK